MDYVEFQHVNVKLFVKKAGEPNHEALIPVFHGWIQDQAHGELLLDVADYRHVRSGPGVVLIGHQGNYSLDNSGGRLGVRYNRKAALEGTNQDRLVQAAQAALGACQRLETEPSLDGRIQFNGREIEVSINDRLLAPNTPETRTRADSEFTTFFSTLFGDVAYEVSYPQDHRSVFSVHVTTSQVIDTSALLNNLNSMAPAFCRG
jgi:hypothetical protein